jgi:hypothetical protein
MTEKIYCTYIEKFESKDDFRSRSYSNKVSFFIALLQSVYCSIYLCIPDYHTGEDGRQFHNFYADFLTHPQSFPEK